MSGHSKWKTIQHKKGAADAKRGKIFSRLSKELTLAARAGGGNIEMNPALRTSVAKARAANMPAENIDRAIKKGTGELEGAQLEEALYEGYIAGGIAVVVQALTDNKNRAASEIRHIFTKYNTSFAQQGAVSRGFKRKGVIVVDASVIDEDKLMSIVLEAGAEDMANEEDSFEIITDPSTYDDVVQALVDAQIETVSSEISLVPDMYSPVNDIDSARTAIKFIEALEELDDVQNVFSNMDVSSEMLKELQE
ncbi:MAG: YebC/PmpR family DNA-binding transcriptional regulator [Lentisphaerae bacterium]|nr:YebC/PmpR family DNA-binding transcriptional regulator [Lentisphaerota bacterium]